MAASDIDWKMAVQEKLISLFEKDVESLTRILWYLDEEDKAYNSSKDGDPTPPVWKTLKLTLRNDKVFKSYAQRLATDTKRAEKDKSYRETMNIFYSNIIDPCEEPAPDDLGQQFDVARLADRSVTEKSGFIGLARAWSIMPGPTKAAIMKAINKTISNKQLASCVDEVFGLVSKAGGSIVMVGLAAILR